MVGERDGPSRRLVLFEAESAVQAMLLVVAERGIVFFSQPISEHADDKRPRGWAGIASRGHGKDWRRECAVR